MKSIFSFLLCCFHATTLVDSFSVNKATSTMIARGAVLRSVSSDTTGSSNNDENSNNNNQDAEQQPTLILSDIDTQMAKLRSKYPTSEADFLAAARARNAAKAASINAAASDADWKQVAAEEAKRRGVEKASLDDDWEKSLNEAGSAESQILIPVELESSGDGGAEDEPKLLLF